MTHLKVSADITSDVISADFLFLFEPMRLFFLVDLAKQFFVRSCESPVRFAVLLCDQQPQNILKEPCSRNNRKKVYLLMNALQKLCRIFLPVRGGGTQIRLPPFFIPFCILPEKVQSPELIFRIGISVFRRKTEIADRPFGAPVLFRKADLTHQIGSVGILIRHTFQIIGRLLQIFPHRLSPVIHPPEHIL